MAFFGEEAINLKIDPTVINLCVIAGALMPLACESCRKLADGEITPSPYRPHVRGGGGIARLCKFLKT